MKRIILLLLVLICFQNSYSEELSAEQQQLAWKFIYENMLSKEYLPNIFKEDITINLKGEITSEDSIAVKDLIKSFQKAIPQLKVELSPKMGNLILGLNDGKRNNITTNTSSNHTVTSQERYFPDHLAQAQRKQFIYYQLFKGLVVNFNPPKDIDGVNGCVFAENDFKSITFSPFDLFILEKLYAPDFSIQLARNLTPELKEMAWSSIRTKFLGKTKEPIIYRDEIAIKLEGKVSTLDSVIMNELIDQLKMIIPTRKIYLTSKKANLIVNFKEQKSVFEFKSLYLPSSIQMQNIVVFNQNISKEDRKKTLYFHLARSLVNFSTSKDNSKGMEGCVFEENEPESITYTPIDAFILNTLYAVDFHEQFKNQFIRQFSYRLYLVHMYHSQLDFIFFLLGLLIPAILLIRIFIKGGFKAHNWSWKEFIKQGLYLVAIGSIFLICISLSELKLGLDELNELLYVILSAFVSINLIYFLEKLIIKNRNLGGAKILIIYFTTLLGMLFSFRYKSTTSIVGTSKLDVLNQKTLNDYFSIINIIIVPIARSLYIFLNDRYKSIINQKDVELAQMGELHKQAELQSLRAKINPHFLYNALNSIASLATTDARKTEQMALALSDFFKYSINREQKQLNTLSEELNAIRTYLEIEKVRFGERLHFEIDCPSELLDIQIPQLLIQPLVENAIKHGLSQITENGQLRIAVSKVENELKIRVYDNGPAFPGGPLTGFGIQNTQERIALLYGTKAVINWQNGEDKYIEISLPIVN